MNEKFYEKRRREEKSISFGVIKKTSKGRVALCTPQGSVCSVYISIFWLLWSSGQVALQIIATPSAALLSIHQPFMLFQHHCQNGKI